MYMLTVKGFIALTQLICYSNMNILNVCAKFPGSTHESHIWRISPLLGLLKHSIGHKSYFLLGDCRYGLRPWPLTPLTEYQPNTPGDWLCRTRSLIERCNGVLKMRFRCLLKHRVLHYAPEKASSIIKLFYNYL
uniref:Putative nuclease HARBI1 n=1 Tax=Sipha flava TaxID=143950 RepID=A0A2S2PZW2_9HEMI